MVPHGVTSTPRQKEPSSLSITIVGAGIAGLAAAHALCEAGVRKLRIVESEDLPFSRASGSNAAIFRPLESDPELARLALESLSLLKKHNRGSEAPLLEHVGLALLHDDIEQLRLLARHHKSLGGQCTLVAPDDTRPAQDAMEIRSRLARAGVELASPLLWTPDGGVLDPHRMSQALLGYLRSAGIKPSLGTDVRRLVVEDGRCTGVELASGEQTRDDAVVLAAGAGSGPLALAAGSPLPLITLKRHLALLDIPDPPSPGAPVIWRLGNETYFRPESGGILASPCDETPVRGQAPQRNLSDLEGLHGLLAPLSERFDSATVRRYWACIRTKSPDSRPNIGQDPSLPCLYHINGLAGFGMSCGLAAGQRLSRALLHEEEDAAFSPHRFRHSISRMTSP
jgi:D-arginine dehydrogenase